MGWPEEEFSQLVYNANRAFELAEAAGVGLAIENADSALLDVPGVFYGMTGLMQKLNPAIGLQLDTANLFTGPVPVSAADATIFISEFSNRVVYLHLKSAQDGQPMPTLVDNPLSFSDIFTLLADHDPLYVAIELVAGPSLEETKANTQRSIEYLKKNDLM